MNESISEVERIIRKKEGGKTGDRDLESLAN